jgi:hypothetical protein
MKTLKLSSVVVLIPVILMSMQVYGQDFLPAYDRFSGKSPVFVTLKDGTQIAGTLEDVDRKKEQIISVSVKDSAGNVQKLAATDIRNAYLKPSAYSKSGNDYLNAFKVQKWDDTYLKSGLIAEGYSYFEQANVELKGVATTLLLQLLNPGFSNKIKVFYDPYAQETGGLAMMGGDLKLTGGEDKSYYVQVGDKTAVRTKKKDYDRLFKEFYSDCPELIEKISKNPKWNDFAKHVYAYTFDCK